MSQELVTLYLMGCEGKSEFSKIGIAKNPSLRLKTLQCGNPNVIWLETFWQIDGRASAEFIERTLHCVFDNYRAQGEWFSVSPKLIKPLVEKILSEIRNGVDGDGYLHRWKSDFDALVEPRS